MCRVLGVARSGYDAWRRRPPSARAHADQGLSQRIRAIHEQSRGTYGAPRIRAELRETGVMCSRKRVARLLRRAGLQGCHRRTGPRIARRKPATPAAPDLVRRAFAAPAPDRLWVADITYVPTWAGFLYLAVVLDVHSRRVVGWAMAEHLRSELVVEAVDMATSRRRPAPGSIHHSDQGSQYASLAFGQRLREAGLLGSMGSRGDCFDNALAEGFFATRECELLARQRFPTRNAARLALFEYIEGFSNTRRRHSALGYLSPAAHERRWPLSQQVT
ncbi:MAG: putative transposase [Thermomicrobiales bacterium]|jgi:putative transposase|nr:putative transposase [Thermomicrobiales bacterium]